MADETIDDLSPKLVGNESLELSTNDHNHEHENEHHVLLESTNKELLKLIKLDIEEKILSKIKHSFDDQSNTNKTKKYEIVFTNDFQLDKLGNTVRTGETAICEGWHVPKYENEYQNLLGLPHTEDSPSDTIKIKKPTQECFNCLATNHKITECPIKHDQERIQMHRKNFASQSLAAFEQAQLFSNRYTNDSEQANRGFVPGKISDHLKEALGLSKGQLPPYIYIMRELGYPIGWLKEAQVKKSGLCVLDGKLMSDNTESEIESGEEKEPENPEYDPEKIIDFIGFNQPVPEGFIDEWRIFGVKRFNDSMSKKNFISKLKLANKKPKLRQASMHKIKNTESSISMSSTQDELRKTDSVSFTLTSEADESENNKNTQDLDENMTESETDKNESEPAEQYGQIATAISGTPIAVNISGINKVPDANKFSVDIGDFKPYEMLSNSTGNYQKIAKLTKELKAKEQF